MKPMSVSSMNYNQMAYARNKQNIAFGRMDDGGNSKPSITKTTSNYYLGCTENPGFKYKSSTSLTTNAYKNIADQYGKKAAAAAAEAARSGCSPEQIEKIAKSLRR